MRSSSNRIASECDSRACRTKRPIIRSRLLPLNANQNQCRTQCSFAVKDRAMAFSFARCALRKLFRDTKQQHAMPRHVGFVVGRQSAEIFGGPNVPRFDVAPKSKLTKTDLDGLRPVKSI